MAVADANKIIRDYLVSVTLLFAVTAERIYVGRLAENADLPAIGFFISGGVTTPYIPGWITPRVQFDCWADSPEGARTLYRLLYDALQGIQNTSVGAYSIESAMAEGPGQDLQDVDIPIYFRVLSFFNIIMKVE